MFDNIMFDNRMVSKTLVIGIPYIANAISE
jgi:hypothetical protein